MTAKTAVVSGEFYSQRKLNRFLAGKHYKKTPKYFIDQKSEAFSQTVPSSQESAQTKDNQLFIKEVGTLGT